MKCNLALEDGYPETEAMILDAYLKSLTEEQMIAELTAICFKQLA